MATLALFARSTESRKALYWFFFSFDAPRKNEKIENEMSRLETDLENNYDKYLKM